MRDVEDEGVHLLGDVHVLRLVIGERLILHTAGCGVYECVEVGIGAEGKLPVEIIRVVVSR